MKIQLKGCLNVHLHCCILSFAEVPSVYIFIHAIGSMRSLNYTSPRSLFFNLPSLAKQKPVHLLDKLSDYK